MRAVRKRASPGEIELTHIHSALSLAFAAALLPCLAQTPAGGQVDGIVVDAVSGAPIRRAVVELRSSSGGVAMPGGYESAEYAAVTGPDGVFHIEQVAAGTYSVTCSRSGYLQPRSGAGFSTRAVRVTGGQAVKGLRYGLLPQAIVSGRVVDDEGDPVEGAQVTLLAYRYTVGIRRLVRLSESSTTNDRGEYRIAHVPAGKYLLQATLDRLPIGSAPVAASHTPGAPLAGYASTFFPGASDAAQAQRVDLHAGQELSGIDIPLQRTTMVRVSGRVIGSDGAPLARANIVLLAAQSKLLVGFGASTDDAGNFTMRNVRAGSYILSANAGIASISAPLEVGATDITGFVAHATPLASVRGTVSVDGVARNFNLASVGIQLRSVDTGAPVAATRPAADGSFSIDKIVPGRYLVSVAAPGSGAYVQSINAGGEEFLGRDLDTSSASAGLRIGLRTDSATLSGTVEAPGGAGSFAPGPGRPVVLIMPADARQRGVDPPVTAPITSKGAFSISGLRPGDYLVYAFDDVDDSELQDPEFLTALEPSGTRLQLASSDKQTINLKLSPWPQAAGN